MTGSKGQRQDLNQDGRALESVITPLLSGRGGTVRPGNNLLIAATQEHSHCVYSSERILMRPSIVTSVAAY